MRVRLTKTAQADLDEIIDYISDDDPAAAYDVVERIDEVVKLLEDQPQMGRLGQEPGTRELVIDGTPYVVPYRVRGEDVELLRILHGARERSRS